MKWVLLPCSEGKTLLDVSIVKAVDLETGLDVGDEGTRRAEARDGAGAGKVVTSDGAVRNEVRRGCDTSGNASCRGLVSIG